MLRFVNQHYAPDVASTGQHLTDLAEHLAAAGVAVEVVTARGHYVGGVLDAPTREVRHGVSVRRLPSLGLGRRSRAGRLIDYGLFYTRVAWTACVGAAPSAARREGGGGRRAAGGGTIYLTTPPLLAVAGWLGRALRGRRYGIWSMDLHPDAEIAAGMLRPTGVVAAMLNWLADRAYRRADFVVVLGAHMQRRVLAKGVNPARTHTVPVWGAGVADAEGRGGGDGAPLRARLGLASSFVVMYSGNAGIVHEFAPILDAARLLRDDATVHFVFVGGGPRRTEIEAFVRAHNLGNVTYLPYVPRKELVDTLAAADVHLISLRAAFAGIAVPGKLYGVMDAGRPALFVGPPACETADAIREADCGVVIDSAADDAADRVVAAIRRWRDDPAAARSAGARGRAAYAARYQPGANCDMFARIVADAWPASLAPAAECGAERGGGTGASSATAAHLG